MNEKWMEVKNYCSSYQKEITCSFNVCDLVKESWLFLIINKGQTFFYVFGVFSYVKQQY